MKKAHIGLWLSLLGVIALACSTAIEQTEPAAQVGEPEPIVAVVQETVTNPVKLRPDQIPLIKGPVSEDGVHAIFATPDLGVGKNRFAFVLVSDQGLIRAPTAAVSSFYVPEAGAEREQKQMRQNASGTVDRTGKPKVQDTPLGRSRSRLIPITLTAPIGVGSGPPSGPDFPGLYNRVPALVVFARTRGSGPTVGDGIARAGRRAGLGASGKKEGSGSGLYSPAWSS